jgi:hypothetical protein
VQSVRCGWWRSANTRFGRSRWSRTGCSARRCGARLRVDPFASDSCAWTAEARRRFGGDREGAALDLEGCALRCERSADPRDHAPSAAAFITSTLQQAASSVYSSLRTDHGLAQKLYEGVDLVRRTGRSHHLHAYRLGETSRATRRRWRKSFIEAPTAAPINPETPNYYKSVRAFRRPRGDPSTDVSRTRRAERGA